MSRRLSSSSNRRLLLGLLTLVICSAVRVVQAAAHPDENVAVNIGVLYGEDDDTGKMGLKCIRLALSHFYYSDSHYKTRIALHPISFPKHTPLAAPSAALHLLKYSEVMALVLGPATSVEAEFVAQLGEKAQVPIISYSPTIPSLSTYQSSYYFIHAAQIDSSQVQALTSLMQAFQWRHVVVIYEDNGYGSGLIPYLHDALEQIGAHIPSHEPILSSATDDQLLQLLQKLKAKQTRVFLVHMSLELASRLFSRVKELRMMDKGYAWITTTSVSNEFGSLNHSLIEAMEGVIGVQTYVPDTEKLEQFIGRSNREFKDIKLNVMGLWAYDAASALARAVEEVTAAFKSAKVAGNVTDLDSFGVSSIGPELLKALLKTSFSGVAGNFSLMDGQLVASSIFRIINVLDSGPRTVGFWTPENKLTRKLSTRGGNPSSIADLRPVIWPGETISPPRGWEIPPDGKKLRVGLPVKPVYEQLVNVTRQSSSSNDETTKPTGFCIQIFETAMNNLGYSGHYEYHPFSRSDGSPAGTYDELVQQVYLQKYDIVVGDITIISNRTEYVDFTLPYTESGVTMVVPFRNDRQSAWVFLKPLTWDLWVAILATFIFIALVIWVLEHQINEEFRGPPLHQLGTSLFCSFSMMVFAQKENVLNNLTRIVVVVWVFVVLVLTQSYTASLTSLLTVQQLKPTVTSVDELISTGAYVGIQAETFVEGLMTRKGFEKSKILSYNSTEVLDNLLSTGKIAAVFDEIPYMKLFLAVYPSKYMMLQPFYQTDGFGFALPKGSPLIPEISREILKIIERGDSLLSYESDLGMKLYNASDAASSRLSLGSFYGLFAIVAVTSVFALCVFLGMFLYKRRDIWMDTEASIWSRIHRLAKAFEQRDMTAHTFRKKEEQSVRNVETEKASVDGDGVCEIETSSTPPRLSNYSEQTEEMVAVAVPTPPSPKLDSHPTLKSWLT